MKKLLILLAILVMAFGVFSTADAALVDLYIDSAPNAYGSPAFAPWRTDAFANAANGTFVNMQHGYDPGNIGTQNFVPGYDAMVYSFDDLGKRMHSVYWIPNETVTSLAGRFKIEILYQYGGTWHNSYLDAGWSTDGWVQPSSWVNYTNSSGISGVVGTFGEAYWGAYGYNSPTPEALAQLALDRLDANANWGNMRFLASLTTGGQETIYEIQAHPTPIPGAVWLLGSGLLGLGIFRRRQRQSKG